MAQPKILTMNLIDGDPHGKIKCTVPNWIGLAFKIPRGKIDSCKERTELKHSGIYFLFGENKVYIGQAGNRKNGGGILNRLFEHKENYWNEAVIFTTQNNSLGSTEISFLENKFCNLALKAKRYEVKNSNDPAPGNITEEKEIELEEFSKYVQIVMLMLGYKIFEPLDKKVAKVNQNDTNLFYLKRTLKSTNTSIEAIGKITADGFMVLAGSQISRDEDDELSANIKKLRANTKISIDNILLEDVPFSSVSTAATFVTGKKSVNGREYWKTADGVTYNEFLKLKK